MTVFKPRGEAHNAPSTKEPSMKKRLLSLCTLAFGLASASAFADPQCTRLTITGSDEYPPIHWRDRAHTSKIVGIGIELVEMAMKEVKVPVDAPYVGNWKRAQQSVRNGEVDLIQGAYMTQERKTYMEYVLPPFLIDKTVIFVPKGRPFRFEGKSDLVGKSGAVPTGNSFGDDFDNFAKEKLKLEYTTTTEGAFKRLLADRSQYVVYGLYPGLAVAETENIRDKVEVLPNSVISEGMYVGISKQSACLKYKDHLARKIQEYVQQGVPDKLLEKYIKLWKEQANMPKP
jgi:polar amino acid transport system substrate-binding protein